MVWWWRDVLRLTWKSGYKLRMDADFRKLIFDLSGRIAGVEEKIRSLQGEIPRQDQSLENLQLEVEEIRGLLEHALHALTNIQSRLDTLGDSEGGDGNQGSSPGAPGGDPG